MDDEMISFTLKLETAKQRRYLGLRIANNAGNLQSTLVAGPCSNVKMSLVLGSGVWRIQSFKLQRSHLQIKNALVSTDRQAERQVLLLI